MRKIIPLILALTVLTSATGPDKRFILKHEEDNVKVYYRWKKRGALSGKEQRTLVLYLANENNYRVQVSFTIDIFSGAFESSSSDTMMYCIPPDYEITGNFRDLEFSVEGTALDTSATGNKDMVEWEINDFNVARNDSCSMSANWREADQ
jgi:hypothetical protein